MTTPIRVDWQRECENATYAVGSLLAVCNRRWAASAVIEILRQVPRSSDALTELVENPDDSILLVRLLLEGSQLPDWRRVEFEKTASALKAFSRLDVDTREVVEASIIGTLIGSGTAG